VHCTTVTENSHLGSTISATHVASLHSYKSTSAINY